MNLLHRPAHEVQSSKPEDISLGYSKKSRSGLLRSTIINSLMYDIEVTESRFSMTFGELQYGDRLVWSVLQVRSVLFSNFVFFGQ